METAIKCMGVMECSRRDGKPTTCRVVRESLTEEMTFKVRMNEEGEISNLDGGNSKSKGP